MIRKLRDDEPIPERPPARYRSAAGYIRLRWLVGTEEYVEAYEHRIVLGRPPGHVHHINGVTDDNRPENLIALTSSDHRHVHAEQNRAAGKWKGSARARRRAERQAEDYAHWSQIATEYAAGASTTELGAKYGRDASNISRGLRRRGYTLRPFSRWNR